jgi:hypothetical protein
LRDGGDHCGERQASGNLSGDRPGTEKAKVAGFGEQNFEQS